VATLYGAGDAPGLRRRILSVRGVKLAAWGLVLFLAAVAFFGGTTLRDSHLLDHGQPTPAVVVQHSSSSEWWNILDSGTLVVRYTAGGETLTRTIWLDDTADARPVGGVITVIVDPKHPAHVRTRSDANDPVPWAPPFLLAGLAGLVMLIVGSAFVVGDVRERGWQRRVSVTSGGQLAAPWVPSGGVLSGPSASRIVLRYYRLFARTPYIEVAAGVASFRVPSVFGGRRWWHVPISEIGVVDNSLSVHDPGEPGWVFVDTIALPFLATTSSSSAPNLRLLFRHPQRIPPVRLLSAFNTSLPYRRSRSAAGFAVDGVLLRAQDPAAAVTIFANAGAERVAAAPAFLARYRQTTTDPVALHETAVIAKRRRLTGVLAWVALPCIVIARVGLDNSHAWWPYAVGGVGLLVGFIVPLWLRRRNAAVRKRLAEVKAQSSLGPG
jgi:hypothetical protein